MRGTWRAIDVFAGAGGFSLGAEQAGCSVEHAFEIDRWACETLQANHEATEVHCVDVRSLTSQWLTRSIARYPDLMIGGPPCQGFSHAGPSRKDPKDPRNSLFREFVRFARVLEPAVVVLENVPGILRARTAGGASVSEIIQQELEELGYSVKTLVLDADRFGVPQIRRRVFFVGSLDGVPPAEITPTHGLKGPSILESGLSPPLTLWDAISDLPVVDVGHTSPVVDYEGPPTNSYQREMREGAGPSLENHVPMRHASRTVERFKQIRAGQSQSDVGEDHLPRRRVRPADAPPATYDQNNRRMYADRPCHTLAASFYANFVHPFLHRNFTPREGARIQSFPDRYVFKGKPTVVSSKLLAREGRHSERHLCQYAQIGNAVPPLLGSHVLAGVLGASAQAHPAKLSA